MERVQIVKEYTKESWSILQDLDLWAMSVTSGYNIADVISSEMSEADQIK